MRLFILSILFLVGLLGCQTTQEVPQKSNLTAGSAKTLLVKGKTTQSEILKIWGSPNIVTQSSNGETVWTYSKQSYDTESSSFVGGLFVIAAGSAVSKGATSSFDVVITFDDKDVVKDFSVTSTQF